MKNLAHPPYLVAFKFGNDAGHITVPSRELSDNAKRTVMFNNVITETASARHFCKRLKRRASMVEEVVINIYIRFCNFNSVSVTV